jgi:serine/threonine-protein kinase
VKVCPKCSEAYAGDVAICPVDGAELGRTNDPYLGRTIAARYRLIRRLGSGGMAAVYLARHVLIDRLSAIKILRQDFCLNPTHRERFLREARAVNRINHENIVEITDCGEMDGVAYLVMEYVEGPTLHHELAGGAFPWLRASRIAVQIALALGRAHQMGVVHRDLKPENILLVRPSATAQPAAAPGPDFVKLTDFGIAKIIDAPALTFSEHLFGTPGYIAPECVQGLPVDRRTDLYSLGVVLYEMMTGKLPYDGKGAELLSAPMIGAPVPPSARTAGIPSSVESLVLQMLKTEKEERPADAFLVAEALSEMNRREEGSSAERTSVPAFRDSAPTIIETVPAESADEAVEEPSESVAAAARRTANVARLQTSEISLRWQSALNELESSIESARRKGGSLARRSVRAAALAIDARNQLVGVERAANLAAGHQAEVGGRSPRGPRPRLPRDARTRDRRALAIPLAGEDPRRRARRPPRRPQTRRAQHRHRGRGCSRVGDGGRRRRGRTSAAPGRGPLVPDRHASKAPRRQQRPPRGTTRGSFGRARGFPGGGTPADQRVRENSRRGGGAVTLAARAGPAPRHGDHGERE